MRGFLRRFDDRPARNKHKGDLPCLLILKGVPCLTLKDFTPDEIRYLLDLAADLKAKKRAGIPGDLLAGQATSFFCFEKTSTRTRCAFEVAAL